MLGIPFMLLLDIVPLYYVGFVLTKRPNLRKVLCVNNPTKVRFFLPTFGAGNGKYTNLYNKLLHKKEELNF